MIIFFIFGKLQHTGIQRTKVYPQLIYFFYLQIKEI
jgi:hypothetical protein